MDDDGKSDPYVKIDVDGQFVQETRISSKSLNPSWDEKFVFMLDPAHVPPPPPMLARDTSTLDSWQYRNGLDKVTIHFNCWDAD